MRIKRDIGKGQLCMRRRGEGGVLLRILGGGVPSGSINPDPVSDQNISLFIRLIYTLLWFP